MPGGDGLCASVIWGQHCSQWAGVCTDGSENEGCQDFGSTCSPCYRGLYGPGVILNAAGDTVTDDQYTVFKRGCWVGQPGNLAAYGVEHGDCVISVNGREATPQGMWDVANRCHKDIAVEMVYWSAAAKEVRTILVL